jgi:putative transposase
MVQRGGRKRHWEHGAPRVLPVAISQRWSLDFVSDTLSDGRRFRTLAIVDDFSRECLTMVVDTSLGGVHVVRELERLTLDRGSRSSSAKAYEGFSQGPRESEVLRRLAVQVRFEN